jgi:hypothetical protein
MSGICQSVIKIWQEVAAMTRKAALPDAADSTSN